MTKISCKNYKPTQSFLYAHYKLDGLWCEYKDGIATSSLGTQFHLPFQLPKQHLYGELWIPGHRASDVKTAIIEEWPNLQFTAFGSPDLPPQATLQAVKEYCDCPFADWDMFSPDLLTKPLPTNCEGYVFKDGNLLNWTKWKPVYTIDCVVLGLIPGLGRNFGKVGSLEVGVYIKDVLTSVAYVGGFTDEEREKLSKNDISHVVEVAYQYIGSGGRLRHPRFVRFRSDKLVEQCTLEDQT